MMLAQHLYDGTINIPEHKGGLITYMRTDSVKISSSSLKQAEMVIEDTFGKEFKLQNPRIFKNKTKNAQEAHEAIRPVNFDIKPETIKSFLQEDQRNLYELIWKRTIASQMKSAKLSLTTL